MKYTEYHRKSSTDKKKQILSISGQKRILRKIKLEQKISIVSSYSEERSAKDPGLRSEFLKMIADIKSRKADSILV